MARIALRLPRVTLVMLITLACLCGYAAQPTHAAQDATVAEAGSAESEAAESEAAESEAAESEDGDGMPMSVEEILARDPELTDYGEEPRCISTHRIRSSEVIDAKHIAFQLNQKQYVLVQLKHNCPMLRRGKPIMTEPTGNRLCIHDGIRAVYEQGLGELRTGPRCGIPGFQTVTKEQIALLKDALKAERRRKKEG